MNTDNVMDNVKSVGAKIKDAKRLFTEVNVSDNERIISAVAGAGLIVTGLIKPTPAKILLAIAGGALLYRGASGNCPVNSMTGRNTAESRNKSLVINEIVSVNKPKEEVYNFWRRLENLPIFMTHLDTVEERDNKRSLWTAKVPGNIITISWEAEITQDQPGDRLAWRSLPGATIENSGEVIFRDSISGGGTDISATITYTPPAGELGQAVSKVFNNTFKKMIHSDIKGFKQYMETGEIPAKAWKGNAKKKDGAISQLI